MGDSVSGSGQSQTPNFSMPELDEEALQSVVEELTAEDSSTNATHATKRSAGEALQTINKGMADGVLTEEEAEAVATALNKYTEAKLDTITNPSLSAPSEGGHQGGGNLWGKTDAMIGAIISTLASVRLMAESRREDQALKTDMAIQVAQMKEAAAQMQMEASISKAEAQIIQGTMTMVSGAMQVVGGGITAMMGGAQATQAMRGLRDQRKAMRLERANTRMQTDSTDMGNQTWALRKANGSPPQSKEAIEAEIDAKSNSEMPADQKAKLKKFMEDNSILFDGTNKKGEQTLDGEPVDPATLSKSPQEMREQRIEQNNDLTEKMNKVLHEEHSKDDLVALDQAVDSYKTNYGESSLQTKGGTPPNATGGDAGTYNSIGASAGRHQSSYAEDGLAFESGNSPPAGAHQKLLETRSQHKMQLAQSMGTAGQGMGQMLQGTGSMFQGLGQIMAGYKEIEAAEQQYASDLCRAMAETWESHLQLVGQDIEDFRQAINKGLETLQAILSISQKSANMHA